MIRVFLIIITLCFLLYDQAALFKAIHASLIGL